MNWHDRQDLITDLNLRIDLKRLADKAFERDDGPLMAILEVALHTLDERLGNPDSYPRVKGAPRRPLTLISRNVRIRGRRTTVKLESEFWAALDDMCSGSGCSIDELCDTARSQYEASSLASAIRVFTLVNASPAPQGAPQRESLSPV